MPLATLFEDMWEDLFGTVKEEKFLAPLGKEMKRSYRVHDTEGYMTLSIDVPGVSPRELNVEFTCQTLVVKHPGLTQRYTIRPEYDIVATRAHLELGVLTLTIPKRLPPTSTKINIEVK
jgi:HSP20 family molecular chaperone IbpA